MTEAGTAIKAAASPWERLVTGARGPAALVGLDGSLQLANSEAEELAAAWESGAADLRGLVFSAAANGGAAHAAIGVGEEAAGGRRSYEIAAIPLDPETVLITGREVSFEHNLTRALLESRNLYKDLVSCADGFVWETDGEGRFSFVAEDGLLDYGRDELTGRAPAALLGIAPEEAARAFAPRSPARNIEITARDRAGRRVRMLVSAVPVIDEAGLWCGARGIARDVTEEREREATLRLDQARNALLSQIVLAIRSEAETSDIAGVAARAAADALRAEVAWALRGSGSADTDSGEAEEMVLEGAESLYSLAERCLDRPAREGSEESADAMVQIGFDGSDCLIARAGAAGGPCAALVFGRDTAHEPWRAHEVELVHGMVDHLAVALKQAGMIARLERLSRTDPLTGLLNRRALFSEVATRIAHQRRTGRPGCFLFVDLDHFKSVNDRFGHGTGDGVLKALGRMLHRHTRVGDLAGRLGGDEFAVWLEDTPIDGAQAKARILMDDLPMLREAAGDPQLPLSMSIGIAPSDPGAPRAPEALAEDADRALYRAKRGGRARIVVAGEEEEPDA